MFGRGRSTAGTRRRNMRWRTIGTPPSGRTCSGSKTPFPRRSSRGGQIWRSTRLRGRSQLLPAHASSARPHPLATLSEAFFKSFLALPFLQCCLFLALSLWKKAIRRCDGCLVSNLFILSLDSHGKHGWHILQPCNLSCGKGSYVVSLIFWFRHISKSW